MSKIYYVMTKLADGTEQPRLIRSSSKSKARAKSMEVVTVRIATQTDMELAIQPDGLSIEDTD
jgi:hypothetical protein